MTAKIIQIRDYQNPKDIERLNRELEQQAADIINAALFSGGIDSLVDTSPCEMDPAS